MSENPRLLELFDQAVASLEFGAIGSREVCSAVELCAALEARQLPQISEEIRKAVNSWFVLVGD